MRRLLLSTIALTVGSLAYLAVGKIGAPLPAVFSSASAQSAACTFPTTVSPTMEETAWRLFVAANCSANGTTQLVWETWIEQSQLYPAGRTTVAAAPAPARRLHGSPLAVARSRAVSPANTLTLTPTSQCNPMQGPPTNVVKTTICEEVHINPDAANYVTSNGYQVRSGQETAAKNGANIQFPSSAVEVKVDWIPASDFATPFTCSNPPAGVHVETIDGVCYAMAGMHISSKLLNNWIWATFEPQSTLTNPLRCTTFGDCYDPWGATPSVSSGGAAFSQLTPALRALMTAANLSPELFNYRLDGVQITFTAPNGHPAFLGNSIIEGENVGMTKDTASCITCHSVSSIQNTGVDGITVLGAMPNAPVGPQYQVPTGWIARDFVWSMALACPNGIQNCQ
jgi:hypothetical protein